MSSLMIGGSFAPPLSPEQIQEYKALAKDAENEAVQDQMLALCKMLEVFWETPKSTEEGTPHRSGRGTITKLAQVEIKRIWDVVPWSHECDAMQKLFDDLPNGSPNSKQRKVRNAAFHLLWFAKELTQDREPITNDQI